MVYIYISANTFQNGWQGLRDRRRTQRTWRPLLVCQAEERGQGKKWEILESFFAKLKKRGEGKT